MVHMNTGVPMMPCSSAYADGGTVGENVKENEKKKKESKRQGMRLKRRGGIRRD